ncbi:MAG: isoaspartyl peptidase/L-asparaginase [Planctomycetes bacterium]|jgi:L-asparaginase/beta-aspartyl-peptidase (threonine type)|nr:isoaspartyl peptidase/L-asparaginase [Planctomycetota bacterium]
MDPIVLTHGGTKSPPEWSDGCERAARVGAAVLRAGGSALDAAVAAVRDMEDDGRFNAGRGSCLRFDGITLEMDAGVMESTGRIGAVAALRGFRHPVDAARAALETPHVLYAGEGAALLARAFALEPWEGGASEAMRERHRKIASTWGDPAARRPAWRDADLGRLWNFRTPLPPELRPEDTVGAVVRDAAGRFAAAASTGGAIPMLLGRVGDTPLPGAGFWAGPHGAVAATGIGEEIIRRLACRGIHDRLSAGVSPAEAIRAITETFPGDVAFGAIAVSASESGEHANRSMAFATARP